MNNKNELSIDTFYFGSRHVIINDHGDNHDHTIVTGNEGVFTPSEYGIKKRNRIPLRKEYHVTINNFR